MMERVGEGQRGEREEHLIRESEMENRKSEASSRDALLITCREPMKITLGRSAGIESIPYYMCYLWSEK